MNGVVIKALLNLVAKYVNEHGEELFEKLLQMILDKLNPTVSFSAPSDPVLAQFSADVDAALKE